MGHGFQILHIIFVIIFIFILISYNFTHNLIVKESFNPPGVYGNEDQKALILEKFRVLLGLKSFHINACSSTPAPAPAPGPSRELNIATDSPAPTPVLHPHGHPRLPSHHHHRPMPSTHKIQKDDKGTSTRVLTAVLVSVGVTSLLLCAIGLFWGCRNFGRRKKRSKRTLFVFSTEAGITGKSKYMSSQSSVKKVSSDPGPDLFYLDSVETASEPDKFCSKLNSETQHTYSNQSMINCTMQESEEPVKELVKSECENDIGEIISACEISEYKYEFNGCHSSSCGEIVIPEEDHSIDDKFIPEEAKFSDDESFHSVCDSHSSHYRLSSASGHSLSDNSEIFSQNESKVSHCSVDTTTEKPVQISHPKSEPPLSPSQPPPPPPPPPPVEYVYPSKSIPSSTKRIPNLLSSSSSESNKTRHIGLSLTPPPPAPPVAPAGIPPPPCPPPFAKGNANPLKIPPPPPSHLTQHTPLGKDGAPLPKLKPLHWDKVRAAPDRSTVWDKLRSSSFEFDEEMIESLFGYNLQNTMKNDEVKSKTPSPSKHVLEPKRLQNITILSKALNVSTEQVCSSLIQGDGLSLQDLEALTKMAPTDEEEAKLANYKGDVAELGSAEKLVKAMLKVPFAFLRIEAMLYRETFEDEVHHLRKSFSMLEEACKELRSSRLFLKLLEAVLKTGNRMNVGTIRGGATAFKLDALLKLADVKGTDGKTTLLHFVVQEIIRSEGLRISESIMGKINQRSKTSKIEDKEESYRRMGLDLVSGLSTELCNVKKMATIDLDVLASSVSNLSDGMSKLQHLVHKILEMEGKNGNFVNSMRSFLKYVEMKLKELQEDENGVLLHVRQMTEYFHGDVSKDESNPLRIFVIVRDFLNMLDNVCKELKSSKPPCSPTPLSPFR